MTKSNRTAMSRAKKLAAKRAYKRPPQRPVEPVPADADRPSAEELERAGQKRLLP